MQTICIHSESLARQCACSRVVLSRSVQPCVHMRHTIAPRQRSLQRTQAAGTSHALLGLATCQAWLTALGYYPLPPPYLLSGGGPKAPDLSDKNGKATSVIQDSDFAFMGKLLAVSVIGELQRQDNSRTACMTACWLQAYQYVAGCGFRTSCHTLCCQCRAGGAAIKYGSLLWSLPFQPDSAVALAVVLGTPAAYSLYLLTQSSKQQ